MEREIKVVTTEKIITSETITEVVVPVKIAIGAHYRIHPCYGYFGIESKNVKIKELLYFKDMEEKARLHFLEMFGFNQDDIDYDDPRSESLKDDDVMVKYEGNIDKETEYMELEFFVSHISACS